MKNILKHKWFIFLFILAAVLRFLYIQDGVIPFGFDHGKDAIAVLDIIVTFKPKFIGPWTSIPGLYFGPAWYYMLLPFYYFGNFDPYWTAFLMSLLVLFQMYLAYKYFNIESSVLVGFSNYWISMSRSAWNPFPMTLLTLVILILLKKQLSEKKVNSKLIFLLFFVAAFGFHFSSAFAIFYPLIIIAILLFFKFKPNLKAFVASVIGFILPFIPQILFELKNNFVESKAIINYFSNGEGHEFNLEKVKLVLNTTIGEFKLIAFELPNQLKEYSLIVFALLLIVSLFVVLKKNKKEISIKDLFFISIIFITIPVFGFFFLHFNVWYVLPLIPVVTILVGTIFHQSSKLISFVFMSLMVLSAFFRLSYYLNVEKEIFISDSVFLPVKNEVIAYIRSSAGLNSFSVYTFVSDIYDFQYQYLFLVQGLQGEELPLDFAYEPGVPSYIREKENILQAIDSKYGLRWKGTPKVIYYIVNGETDSELLNNWWGRQKFGEIVDEKQFGDKVTVYTAVPKNEMMGI